MSASTQPKIAQDDEIEISLYAARKKIYPRAVTGLFAKWRWFFVWLTQAIFYGLPWLTWGQRQAVLFDLEARRFYIFGLVLYPQDFIYLTGILVVSALSLFLFTAIAGRLWCGYACPQTVYTEIYLWLEKLFEGDRSARMRLDQSPWNLNKIARKTGKQLAWIAVGLWTGFTFAGYFTPIRELGQAVLTWELGPWQTFWIFFYGFATYGNAGYMREQVCKYMCPYARFQSAMFDKDTMIVTYDAQRGEPRGPRKKSAEPQALGLGHCIDCTLCVQVCPTGIDIRNGLQYECIGCGACADVCDEVMEKMGYPKGLVKYSTQNGMEHGWSRAQMIRRVFRPRVLIYSSILLAIVAALGVSLWLRVPLKVDVIRDRGALARVVEMGRIENVYRIQLMNASEEPRELRIEVQGLPGIELASEPVVHLLPTEVRSVAVRVQVPPGQPSGTHPIEFHFRSTDGKIEVRERTTFLVPR
ncbi:cytochrome c oxidase accessory protein CcoG [Tepidimonas alkaliphilus]|uniref:Cytochrome c oxidase accessory protein CcoG n=1 Tax=Tepidimonas alkaliphilus TaxID=2588942 RepID=A0A554W5Z2_9BURK|nr:cytochrome c oxidase accessory protein CcoG [Tepidimonas alkaliphilus]TSE19001.1 cytochrome c oxidase accessory protein CcoG [Tepidimonas alkaliphilus]